MIEYYQRRWVIEEWHRVLKEGCRLEASQLDTPNNLQRLAAILSIIAVRLLQLRDLADPQQNASTCDDPVALQQAVPLTWLQLVAALAKVSTAALTPTPVLAHPRPSRRLAWPQTRLAAPAGKPSGEAGTTSAKWFKAPNCSTPCNRDGGKGEDDVRG